jgi:hypothetical protein
LLQFRFGEEQGLRNGQPGLLRAIHVFRYRRSRHAGAAVDDAVREAFLFETEDFFQIRHGYPFSCHVYLLNEERGCHGSG